MTVLSMMLFAELAAAHQVDIRLRDAGETFTLTGRLDSDGSLDLRTAKHRSGSARVLRAHVVRTTVYRLLEPAPAPALGEEILGGEALAQYSVIVQIRGRGRGGVIAQPTVLTRPGEPALVLFGSADPDDADRDPEGHYVQVTFTP